MASLFKKIGLKERAVALFQDNVVKSFKSVCDQLTVTDQTLETLDADIQDAMVVDDILEFGQNTDHTGSTFVLTKSSIPKGEYLVEAGMRYAVQQPNGSAYIWMYLNGVGMTFRGTGGFNWIIGPAGAAAATNEQTYILGCNDKIYVDFPLELNEVSLRIVISGGNSRVNGPYYRLTKINRPYVKIASEWT